MHSLLVRDSVPRPAAPWREAGGEDVRVVKAAPATAMGRESLSVPLRFRNPMAIRARALQNKEKEE